MGRPAQLASALLVGFCITLGGWTAAVAGTTGALAGRVFTQAHAPIAGAHVSANAPSASQTATTDAQGGFAFISLPPDTYAVTVSKEGFETATQPGITVIADNTQTLAITLKPALKTLETITVRGAGGLVKPGTTADVYSINSTAQAKMAALGGGGGLDSAYSAIAAVPGAVVPPGQSGWFQAVHIRGGDVDQVGYEFDGVPVLRSYDNYPTTNAAVLGQQELQVYTGATPANSESQGLSGFINQVIKSGTYPAFATLDLGVGSPVLYNKVGLEVGGATPNRNFSYFIGIGIANQDQRVVDNWNGTSLSGLWGAPYGKIPNACPAGNPANINFVTCYSSGVGPGGWYLGPFAVGLQNNLGASNIGDRENLFNFHIGLPHHKDSGKDDIQVLYDASELFTTYYGSAYDWGVPFVQQVNGTNAWPMTTGLVYTGPVDVPLAANYNPLTVVYQYPNQPVSPFVDPSHRDGGSNGQGIYKLQYQRNFSASAYLRIYGYTYYSDWYNNGPNGAFQSFIAPASADYELSNHTHGVSATYANQVTSQHLLTVQAAVIGASNYRMNNNTMFNTLSAFPFAFAVDSTHPKNGICYDTAQTPVATPVSCYNAKADAAGTPTTTNVTVCTTAPCFDLTQWASLQDASNPALIIPPISAITCGSGPCQWFVAENGYTGGANKNKPLFTSASLSDVWRPNDKLTINLGLRYDRFAFQGSDTSGGARDFWFNAWNTEACAPPIPGVSPTFKQDPTAPCPAGMIPATLYNQPNAIVANTVWQPRLGGTWSLSNSTVLRFNAGKYAEAPSSAYTQYNILDQDLPGFDGPTFYKYGFTGTSHPVGPEISYNYDLSVEHQFAGSDVSFKLTPFYRKTDGQLANFFLDQKTAFVSGLNAGSQTATGFEFLLSKGDFGRNGLSALLSFALTNSYETFSRLSSGGTVLDTVNLAIASYNQFTSFCLTNFADPRCGSLTAAPLATASRCFDGSTVTPATPVAAPDPTCTSTVPVANPYFNAPVQSLFDPNAKYAPYSTLPGGFQSSATGYVWPMTATLVLNFKHDRFAITPGLQYFEGVKYGAPLESPGIDPSTCSAVLATPIGSDPRYPYGITAGGAPAAYDAMTCSSTLTSIPNPFTKAFDNLGAFRQPNQLVGSLQMAYDVSSHVTVTFNVANLISTCFGGSVEPWTRYADHRVCSYNLPGYSGLVPNVGNVYNPGAAFQPFVQFPYQQYYGTSTPTFFMDVKIKV